MFATVAFFPSWVATFVRIRFMAAHESVDSMRIPTNTNERQSVMACSKNLQVTCGSNAFGIQLSCRCDARGRQLGPITFRIFFFPRSLSAPSFLESTSDSAEDSAPDSSHRRRLPPIREYREPSPSRAFLSRVLCASLTASAYRRSPLLRVSISRWRKLSSFVKSYSASARVKQMAPLVSLRNINCTGISASPTTWRMVLTACHPIATCSLGPPELFGHSLLLHLFLLVFLFLLLSSCWRSERSTERLLIYDFCHLSLDNRLCADFGLLFIPVQTLG
ncbi:uncharacterized protein EV422DRAFT_161694 [Fimicolochytrium jonesii]|uniref:uncharacterized protein n=1 Tax=Fimicolochytrium jonesii TaxID=1396493 RepID=UPI0022FE0CA0|nr:uncharacterized protein EV422DRAFT_161694 [Fimicolochytrium jonesii]KAI8818675.1 hypothetical protein EV422DRAFT_161694 [Fimicolochytrium jonesii]